MADKIIAAVNALSDHKPQRDGRTCYPTMAGSYGALITCIGIAVEVYGNEEVKEKVLEVLEKHLKFMS